MASVLRGSGDSSFGGNLSIEGVLTYEDVASVDSVGVITARSGIEVTGHTETDTLNVSGIVTTNAGIDISNTIVSNNDSTIRYDDTDFVINVDPNNVRGSSKFKINVDTVPGLVIDDNRRLGIGTDNPQTLQHLKSDDPTIRIQRNNQNAYGDVTVDTAGKITFKSDPGNAANGDGFSFTVNNSEKVGISSDGLVGIDCVPSYKLQVNGSFFVDNSSSYLNKHIIKGSGSWTATSNVLHVSKTFNNGAYFNAFRFNRVNADSNNNKIGVLGGKLHIVYINDRSNSVQTSGYDVFPFVVRGRSADTMTGTIGSVETDIHDVIGSSVQVRFVSASTTTIDMQIYIYNSDGGGAEQLCHAWIETGEIGTDTNRMIFPTLL